MKIGPGKPNADGSVPLNMPDDTKIEVSPVKTPSLVDGKFDPFSQYKTEPDEYYYRAINIRPQNMRERKAQGYEVISGAEYGDLVLARLPLHEHERRIVKEQNKIKQQEDAAKERFKSEAAELGVKTFEGDE